MEETASTSELAMMAGMALTPIEMARVQWRGCRGGWASLNGEATGRGGARPRMRR
jgi:hypothetical protein